MLQRRSTALVAVLLPLAAALTSCGFDYPTDRVNTIAAGVNNREASVDVLGARILAYSEGQGRLIGTLVYNENEPGQPAVLAAIEGADNGIQVQPQIEIPGNGSVNLAGDDIEPIAVTGEFTAGDVVTLTYTFDAEEQEVVSLDVPVVKPCGQYSGIESPEFEESPAAGDEHASEEHTEEGHEEEADATFLCDHPTEAAEEEGGH